MRLAALVLLAQLGPGDLLGSRQEQTACEPRPGARAVRARVVEVPRGCKRFPGEGLSTDRPVVIRSARAFRARLGCDAPVGFDFAHEQLVVASIAVSVPSTISASLGGALEGPSRVTLRFDTRHVCQGIAQRIESRTQLVAIPASNKRVEVVICDRSPLCGQVR